MIKANIKIDRNQIEETGECHLEVELSTDRIKGEGCNMITTIEVTLGEELIEEGKTMEVKILVVDIEVTIERKIFEEVDVHLERDSVQVILEEMIKAVVDQDQV